MIAKSNYKILMQLTKTNRIQPKRGHQTDKYEGTLHPTSKLRHGTGMYRFDNSFFTYEGNYEAGKKNGKGILKMKDGTVINGTFESDQLNGQAEITYSHGACYKGNLQLGQKSGQGTLTSMFEEYTGEWKDNHYHGQGKYHNLSTGQEYVGEFQKGKYHGKGKICKWNYSYQGAFEKGLKQGEGKEISDWSKEEGAEGVGRYQYCGNFCSDCFEGEGQFKSRDSKYCYKGLFSKGKPCLYPNQFRVEQSLNVKNGEEVNEGEKTLVGSSQALEYQLQGDSLNLYIENVYQGPEELDPIQPTQEEIQNMVKNWQNENKKNKSPPPMPDFNQPRMKKPELELVSQETGRTMVLRLLKQVDGKEEPLKIDYRCDIENKRKQNEDLRQQALKKAEEDGGKKGGKKDNKGQPELKVNIFKQNPSRKEVKLELFSTEGKTVLNKFQLPDDFPPGKYILEIGTSFDDFGCITSLKKELNVKVKAAGKKK